MSQHKASGVKGERLTLRLVGRERVMLLPRAAVSLRLLVLRRGVLRL